MKYKTLWTKLLESPFTAHSRANVLFFFTVRLISILFFEVVRTCCKVLWELTSSYALVKPFKWTTISQDMPSIATFKVKVVIAYNFFNAVQCLSLNIIKK